MAALKNFWECWRNKLLTISLALAVLGSVSAGIYRSVVFAKDFTKGVIKSEVQKELDCFTSRLTSIEGFSQDQAEETSKLKDQIKENNKLVHDLILAITTKDG